MDQIIFGSKKTPTKEGFKPASSGSRWRKNSQLCYQGLVVADLTMVVTWSQNLLLLRDKPTNYQGTNPTIISEFLIGFPISDHYFNGKKNIFKLFLRANGCFLPRVETVSRARKQIGSGGQNLVKFTFESWNYTSSKLMSALYSVSVRLEKQIARLKLITQKMAQKRPIGSN